jgi:hypothetical protein
VAAIVGVVFVVLGEQHADKARTTQTTVTPAIAPAATTSLPASTPPSLDERRSQPARTMGGYPSAPTRHLTSALPGNETTVSMRSEASRRSDLNGQFHELAAELRTLYQQAADLERRLRGLTEIADRIEGSSSDSFGTDEEAATHSAFDSTTLQ